jgi:hypothetical protein
LRLGTYLSAIYFLQPALNWNWCAREQQRYPNSITLEPVPPEEDKKGRMKWFWNGGHYKTEAGDVMLKKVLGLKGAEEYPDFGRRLL